MEKNSIIVLSKNKLTLKSKKILNNIKKISRKQLLCLGIILLVLIIIISVLIYIFDAEKNIANYSIVYRTENGVLKVTTNNGKSTTRLASNTSSIVRYANNTNRYILYTKENNLYLFDENKGDKTKKIEENVSDIFGFSQDDKFIYYLNNNNELYSYKSKSQKLDDNVLYIYAVSKDYIIYQKEETIYYSRLNGKEKPKKIASNIKSKFISKTGKKLVYLTDDGELYKYEIGTKNFQKIANNVSKILDISDDFTKIFYSNNNNDIYYEKNDKNNKMISNVDSLYYVDANKLEIIYILDNKLFYQKETNESIKITEIKSIISAYLFNNELYFVDNNNTLNFSKLGSKNATVPKEVLKDVDDKVVTKYKNGLIIFSSRNGTIANLNIVRHGKSKEIGKDILVSSLTLSHNKKNIYYINNYDNNSNDGTLVKFNGSKSKNLIEDVYNFNYIKDDIIYVQVNYSNKLSDLKVIYKNKIKNIEENVTDVIYVPIEVK